MLNEHTLRDSHKKRCIDCGYVWNCHGCVHRSENGLCHSCREIQHEILEREKARFDTEPLFFYK
jgi:hypothetical protein